MIIDGVDVSECKYNKGYCRISALCDYSGHICEVDHDCYYKQLKRKEQECKELIDNNFELAQKYTSKREQELQAENERLKSIVESNNQQVEQAELLVMDNDRLQQEVENLKDTIYYDVEKYRQTLQEIKTIAENRTNYPCGKCIKTEILQKITKAEQNNEI